MGYQLYDVTQCDSNVKLQRPLTKVIHQWYFFDVIVGEKLTHQPTGLHRRALVERST